MYIEKNGHTLVLDGDGMGSNRPVPFINSPNYGGDLTPMFIVMHYTAGPSAESAIRSLTDPKRKASAHFVIDGDGRITQLIPTNKVSWHAGVSAWKDLRRMNLYSIGIELVNAGKLLKAGSRWKTWWGTVVAPDNVFLPQDYYTVSKYGGGKKVHVIDHAFEIYYEAQIDAAMQLCKALRNAYPGIEDILGHSDVAVPEGRKIDPGPAFPMEEFRAALFDRCDQEDYDGNS